MTMQKLFNETLNSIFSDFQNTLEDRFTRNEKDQAVYTAKQQMIGAYKLLTKIASQQIIESCEQDLKKSIEKVYDTVGWNYIYSHYDTVFLI